MKIKINHRINFDTERPPLLIAEISSNHKGNKKKFLELIKKAHESGADLIKIQTYEPKDITINSSNKKNQIKDGLWKGKNIWDLYKQAYTPFSWHSDAFKLAKKIKANLFSTPFSERAVDFLEKFKVPLYKVSSFEITDLNLITKIAKTNKPVIISTGLANLQEIERALKIIRKYHNKIIIMYCVSGYPTPEKEVNIKTINLFKKKFKKNLIGLSDHTNDIYSSLTATSLGVVAIEKHFKLKKNSKSLDSEFSITPDQIKILKRFSIKIFNTLGKEKKKLKSSEKKSLIFRRSIFTIKDIKKGQKFNKNNIGNFRPKIGLCSSHYFDVIGRKAKINIKKNRPITRSMIL
jgi:pseudaminic acid synthase